MKKYTEPLFKNYPKKGVGDRFHYVKYPVMERGCWYAANVLLPDGYFIPVNATPHRTEQECRTACDLHNRFHWWTEDDVNKIVNESMSNSAKKQTEKA